MVAQLYNSIPRAHVPVDTNQSPVTSRVDSAAAVLARNTAGIAGDFAEIEAVEEPYPGVTGVRYRGLAEDQASGRGPTAYPAKQTDIQ